MRELLKRNGISPGKPSSITIRAFTECRPLIALLIDYGATFPSDDTKLNLSRSILSNNVSTFSNNQNKNVFFVLRTDSSENF